MTIDSAALVAQYGAYYIDEGNTADVLKNIPYTPTATRELFREVPMTGDYYRGSRAEMDTILQPFQKAFTTKGTLAFTPNDFPLFRLKIDLSIYPDDIVRSYAGFLANVAETDRAQWPMIRWIMEKHIPKVLGQDYEKKIAYGGVYVAPVAGVASAAQDSMDGIKEVLKDYNTAGRLNLGDGALAMGALAADPEDFCTQVEEWVDSMNPEVRAELDKIVFAPELETRYKRGKRKKYGLNVNFLSGQGVSDLLTIEDYPHISVKGVQSHAGSDLIWATPEVNRIRPTWGNNSAFKVESVKREVAIFRDWFEALEFDVPELVIVNDSAIFA